MQGLALVSDSVVHHSKNMCYQATWVTSCEGGRKEGWQQAVAAATWRRRAMLLEGRKEEEREVVGWGGVERERKTEQEIQMRKIERTERKTERCGQNNVLCFVLISFHVGHDSST
ncbi:hypothetical protein Droror1_Dr00007646 [Drosera rotundifolia]